MVRTSKSQPSSMDAGGLDDLDLDGMFAEDNDMLFDGLDVMEDIGGILPTNKQRTGPRTQRPVDNNEEASTPKRRKTKRKPKTPVAFGDEDGDYMEDAQPKKKRKSKASTAGLAPTTTKKGKKATAKTKKSLIPSPIAGKASSTVAAAGRFGKRGSSTKIAKRKSAKAEELTMPAAPQVFVPKHEPTYGGLPPSKTEFYPFMESVPPEPNLKSRKQYPLIDKVFAAFNAAMTNSGTTKEGETNVPDLWATLAANINMESPIMQLLIESFEGTSEKDKAAFDDAKKQTLLATIPKMRDHIENADTMKLLPDLYSLCGLLTRQHNFLKTSIANMETWCKNEFSDSDYRQAFSLPEPFRPERIGTAISSSNRKWKKLVIGVKIVFAGHKDVKGTPTLQAKMPQVLVTGDKKGDSSKTKKAKAKEKSTGGSSSSTKKTAVLVVPKVPVVPRTYPDLTPAERRQRVLERVSQLALGLESQLMYRRSKRAPPPPAPLIASKSGGETKSAPLLASFIPPEDPSLHTARMWEWLEIAGFFQQVADFDGSNASQKFPELLHRGIRIPTPTRIRCREGKSDEEETKIASDSLFDRLQSLLVMEGGASGNLASQEMENETDFDSDSDDESLGFLDETDDEDEGEGATELDLSELTLEERTFIHLRSIGLIKKSVFPDAKMFVNDCSEEEDDSFVDIIGEMTAELSKLTSLNNSRVANLENVMDPSYLAYKKQLEDEQTSLVARCQSHLKRSKEKAKKSNKQKTSVSGSKDGLNLPW